MLCASAAIASLPTTRASARSRAFAGENPRMLFVAARASSFTSLRLLLFSRALSALALERLHRVDLPPVLADVDQARVRRHTEKLIGRARALLAALLFAVHAGR